MLNKYLFSNDKNYILLEDFYFSGFVKIKLYVIYYFTLHIISILDYQVSFFTFIEDYTFLQVGVSIILFSFNFDVTL